MNCKKEELIAEFREPPPKEDCPICMVPIPYSIGMCGVYTTYQPCCGKTLCKGCVEAARIEIEKGNMKDSCAFCRVPNTYSDEKMLERVHKRMKLNDAEAFCWLGGVLWSGAITGFPQDKNKAVEYFIKAAKLGSCKAHNALALALYTGQGGVEHNDDKAFHHLKIAAIGGHEYARYKLGTVERNNGNTDLAVKHLIASARAGYVEALKEVGKGYKHGFVTKDEYASTLQAYQDSIDEVKSEQRSIAHALRKNHVMR